MNEKVKIIPENPEDQEIVDQTIKMINWIIENPKATPNDFINKFIEKQLINDNITIETCQNDKNVCFNENYLSKMAKMTEKDDSSTS